MKNKSIYWKWGLTAFLTVVAVLVFYDSFTVTNGSLARILKKLFSILAPVLYGFGMAYLLTPVVRKIECGMERLVSKGGKAENLRAKKGWLRGVSILLTWIIVLLTVYLLMVMLIPQLVDSINNLIQNARNYYGQIYAWADGLLKKNPQIEAWASEVLDDYYNSALTFLTDKILPWAQETMTNLSGGLLTGIWSIVTFAKNLIVGIIISVYLMWMKETSVARCCKALYAIFKEEQAKWIVRGARRVNEIFSGFVRGKLLDSLIIGLLCLLGCAILNIPYAPLVGVIVGITNIIPFFGPFLGAIPSAFLILLASPIKCLYFIIFVVLLQQLDGNVIGPKILGGSTGISSFWVVVAILVGGGFGGVLGMFLGVPIFACLQSLCKFLMDRRLQKRNMPLEACAYVNRDKEDMIE